MRLFGCGSRRIRADYHGFTLFECLVSLVVLSVILVSFSWFFQIYERLPANQSDSARLWHLFILNSEGTSREWDLLKVEEKRLFFKDRRTDATLKIELVSGQLRKRQGRSSELLLEGIKRVNYRVDELGVRMDVTFNDGKSYQGNFPQWQTN